MTDAETPPEPPGTTRPRPGATAPSGWPTGRLLSAAARRVEHSWDQYLQTWSLSHASLPLLVVLAQGPRSQRELAADLRVTEQTTSRMLRGLERQGYVVRTRHERDRRRHVVAITQAGQQALSALDDRAAVESLLGSALSGAELAQLRVLLLRLLGEDPG